tara:strand:- start:5185 stop:6273 length:1089 start_codon:yes stop_codon:yes gene_type:complete
MSEEELSKVRASIDNIDMQIQELLSKRANAAKEIASIKLAADENATFYRPEREAQVLKRIKNLNKGPLDDEKMARLFREIMSACLSLENPLKVAYLGPEGTFTQEAALKHFGNSINTEPMSSISDVFTEVESGSANYGVVPIENSTEGVVNHTLDMFLRSPLKICGEVSLRIHHNLLTKKNINSIAEIRKVYSHQQSLAQCRGWLDRHLPNIERISVGSNSEAASLASGENRSAAIASDAAGSLYGLNTMATKIEDEAGNMTRFLVIGSYHTIPSGDDKTSLVLSTKNEAGGLYRMIKPLSDYGISMTRIESRPSRRGNWDYVFFIDIVGHRDDENISKALEELRSASGMYKELGSYPQAVI